MLADVVPSNLAASGIAGILWTTFSPSWAFAYLTGWMILAALGLLWDHRPRSDTNLDHG